jgi:hypothetical protein
MPLFLIFIIFNNHSHNQYNTIQSYIHSSFIIRRGLSSCILIASSLSKRRTSMRCRAENFLPKKLSLRKSCPSVPISPSSGTPRKLLKHSCFRIWTQLYLLNWVRIKRIESKFAYCTKRRHNTNEKNCYTPSVFHLEVLNKTNVDPYSHYKTSSFSMWPLFLKQFHHRQPFFYIKLKYISVYCVHWSVCCVHWSREQRKLLTIPSPPPPRGGTTPTAEVAS